MKFLTDENIGLSVVGFLRQLGHDVRSVIEDHPGASDTEVLGLAKKIIVSSLPQIRILAN